MTDEKFRVRLILVRHAQSEANLLHHLICGRSSSSALTPHGENQSILLGKRFKFEKFQADHFLCSSAVRAKRTAEIILQNLQVDLNRLIVSDELVEQSQGQWEGLNRAEKYNDEVLQQMKQFHVEFCTPEGESMRMVQKRAVDFLEPWIKQAKEKSIQEKREIRLLVTTHANLIRTVLQYYLDTSPQHAWLIDQRNTAINEILFDQLGTSLIKINDFAHLTLTIPDENSLC